MIVEKVHPLVWWLACDNAVRVDGSDDTGV